MVSLVKGVGIGASVGAGLGALSSDDGYGTGALRGGIAGAGIGALAHGIPRGIDAAYKSSGLTKPRDGLLGEYAKDAMDSFKGTYTSVNNEQNKNLMKSFVPGVKKAVKTSADDRDFSLKMVDNMVDNVKSFSKKDMDTISNIGKNVEDDLHNLSKKASTKELGNFFEDSIKTFQSATTSKKVGIATAAVTDAGLNSVKSHLIEPTMNMFGKIRSGNFRDIQKHEVAATAFNSWGAYEMGGAVNDISDGNYGSAVGTLAMMGAGKLAYGQGANILKVNSMLKERGMTWSGVGKAGVGGMGANKFYNGTKAWTPEDQTSIMNKFQNVAGQFNG